jgi:hypothetical protein
LIPDAAFALHSLDTRIAQWRATLGATNNLPARRFYQAMGGRTGATRTDRRGELVFEDIAYLWEDIGV